MIDFPSQKTTNKGKEGEKINILMHWKQSVRLREFTEGQRQGEICGSKCNKTNLQGNIVVDMKSRINIVLQEQGLILRLE